MVPLSLRRLIDAIAIAAAVVPVGLLAYFHEPSMPAMAAAGLLLSVVIFCALRWFPLRLLDEALARVQQKERELSTQNIRFQAALENMPHALCMFDGDQRLVVCNTAFARTYRLTSEETTPGIGLRAILERRVAMGTCPQDTAKFIDTKMRGAASDKSFSVIDRLQDGRSILVARRPVEGGGWVSTHQDITEQRRVEEKIAHMSQHDPLTNLPNRMFLRDQLGQRLGAVNGGAGIAVLWLDLDHFKQVNETLGHPIGDILLCEVARRLRESAGDGDVVARIGGDEFAIIQAGLEQPTGAIALAQQLVHDLGKPFNADGNEIVVTASIGVAVAPDDGSEPDLLLKNADLALHRAKDQGRNGYCFFEAGMDEKMRERRALELDLRKATAAGEFELYFQPIVHVADHRVSGFEALLRWHHPTRGVVSPTAFIPLAEETGLIVPIGEWVLRRACAEAAKWPDDVKIAINLSPVQFRSDGLVATVMSAIAAAGIAPGRVELEITEAILLENSEATLTMLHQLRRLGTRICMDDFGTGYSSLSYLRSFPFDKIKIDRSFVRDLERDRGSIAIIRAVAGLGANLGVTTTVEGVETEEQLERIRTEGCTEVQGYLFGKPQPAADVAAVLAAFGHAGRAVA